MVQRIPHKIENNVEYKRCGKCKEYHTIDTFNACSHSWDKLRPTCKKCLMIERSQNKMYITEYNKKYWKETMDAQKEKSKKWRQKNKEYIKNKMKEWLTYNKEWKRNYDKRYRKEHYDTYKKSTREWRRKNYIDLKTNPERAEEYLHYKIKTNTGRRIRDMLMQNKSVQTIEYLGTTIEKLKIHLESQFKDGMNWKNYGGNKKSGEYATWHIDHIIPCEAFDLSNTIHQRACFNYKNLQPLWADENVIKKDSYDKSKRDNYLQYFIETSILI